MADIRPVDIHRIDLWALYVFTELVRWKNATLVAERLSITQSTVSHTLRRLRELFSDELFIRHPSGLEPTAVALVLAPRVHAVLAAAQDIFQPPGQFDPRRVERVIALGLSDYATSLIAAPLVGRVRRAAPGISLSFRSAVRDVAKRAIAAGDLDFGIGFYRAPGDQFERRILFEDGYAVVARRNHPRITGKLSLALYTGVDHALVSLDGDLLGIVDDSLSAAGAQRKVVTTVSSFFAALDLVARTDLVVTLPWRLAAMHHEKFGLTIHPPPLPIRKLVMSAIRHRRSIRDPLSNWLLAEIAAVLDSDGNRKPGKAARTSQGNPGTTSANQA
ncbi:MAG: LysR family transcriptional regulator [Burkholderiales bacterium]